MCLSIDPKDPIDLSGTPDSDPLGAESAGREPYGGWHRIGFISERSDEYGSSPARTELIPLDAGVPEMVSTDDGEFVATARQI